MQTDGWLPLNEYSIRHGVSLSTLRRRIKANDIKFRFINGKYWLPDQPTHKHLNVKIETTQQQKPKEIEKQSATETSQPQQQEVHGAEPLLWSANQLLQEIKGAYIKVLQEKEEQVLQLREEVADLRTLIKILEAENERMKANIKELSPINSWLDKEI